MSANERMVTIARCVASSLPKALTSSLLEKVNCARRFKEKPYLKNSRSYVVRPNAPAAHDERARKNGYKHKMQRIELTKSFDFVVA